MFADQAEPAFGIIAMAVEGDDAGGFLAAVLQGVEAEGGDRRGLGMAENAEDAAFLAQAIGVRIEILPIMRGVRRPDAGRFGA